MIEADASDVKRFLSFIDKLPNGCWFWTGARSRGKGNKKWYGTFWVSSKKDKDGNVVIPGRSVRAHRFASEVFGGKVCPPGHHRDHTCCFSLCVNDEHIEIVTHEENETRKKERKRGRD